MTGSHRPFWHRCPLPFTVAPRVNRKNGFPRKRPPPMFLSDAAPASGGSEASPERVMQTKEKTMTDTDKSSAEQADDLAKRTSTKTFDARLFLTQVLRCTISNTSVHA